MTEATQLVDYNVITKELIGMSNLPKNQIKRQMDENYLSMLVKANPNLDRQHFVEFITKCQLTGADPRLNQIYLIVHDSWNSQTQRKEPKGTTVFSYQFFIRLAQQTGQLEDFDVETFTDEYLDFNTTRKRPSITAKAWVKRKGQGKFNYKARLWEFAKTTKDGLLMGNWKASPYLMLEKCAIANVMRWAFPEVLGNFYVADEMERATDSHTEHKSIVISQEAEKAVESPKLQVDPITKMIQYFSQYDVTAAMLETVIKKPIDNADESDMNMLREISKRLTNGESFDKIISFE